MTGCNGTNLDRVCRELEGMECKKLTDRNLRLGMDVETSTILVDVDSNVIAMQLEPTEGLFGSDAVETFALQEGASEKMRQLVSLTLDDLVINSEGDELLQTMNLHARTQWHAHRPILILPPFDNMAEVIRGKKVDDLEDFGCIPIQFLCRCPPLDYEGLSDNQYYLSDLLSDAALRLAHLVAIGQRQPGKPLFW